jgi:hypothetical protein
MRSRGNAGSQRSGGQERHQGLVMGECFCIVLGAGFEQSLDPASGARQHARHLVCPGWGQRHEAR